MIGILFKGEKIITSAHAIERHKHIYQDIEANTGESFITVVKAIVASECWARSGGQRTSGPIFCR